MRERREKMLIKVKVCTQPLLETTVLITLPPPPPLTLDTNGKGGEC